MADDKNKKLSLNEFLQSDPDLAANPIVQQLSSEYGLGDDAVGIILTPTRLTAALHADPSLALKYFEFQRDNFFPIMSSQPPKGVRGQAYLHLSSQLHKHKDDVPDTAPDQSSDDAIKDAQILNQYVTSITGVIYNSGDHQGIIRDALITNAAFCTALVQGEFKVEECETRSESFMDGLLQEGLKRYPDAGEIIAASQAIRLDVPFSYNTSTSQTIFDWPGRNQLVADTEAALAQAESLNGNPPAELLERVQKVKSLLQPWLDKALRTLVIEERDDEWQARMLLALGANDMQYDKAYKYIPRDDGWGVDNSLTAVDQLLGMAVVNDLPNLTRVLFEQRGEEKTEALFKREHYGNNLLHIAVCYGSAEIADYLLSNMEQERKPELLATTWFNWFQRWTALDLASLDLTQLDSREDPLLIEKGMRKMEMLQRHGATASPEFESEVTKRAKKVRVKLPAAFSELARRMASTQPSTGMGGL